MTNYTMITNTGTVYNKFDNIEYEERMSTYLKLSKAYTMLNISWLNALTYKVDPK